MEPFKTLAPFHPRLLSALKRYNKEDFWKDFGAGVTVGLVALPLAIAFAIASGLKPEAGLISAIIGGFIISTLGGSKVQIGGPAGAFIVVLYSILERYGLSNLIIATSMAGILLFLMGLLKIGSLIRFIPIGIIYGFTSGIGLLICISQIKEALGLAISKMPADFFSQIHTLAINISTFNFASFAFCVGTIAFLKFWPRLMIWIAQVSGVRWLEFIPSIVIVLVGGTLISYLLGVQIATISSRFGGIPNSLPAPHLPSFDWASVKLLFGPIITLAFLGAIESLLCARVADNMVNDRHDPNQELMAQGIANFLTPLFGGIAVTGTIARTATNARAGARTPVAGVIHALTVLLIMFLAAPLAAYIPMSILAGILLFIGWNMIEWHEFKRLRQFNLPYRTVFVATFLMTVIFDLTIAVEVGLVLACMFFIFRISKITHIDPIELPANTKSHFGSHGSAADVEAYRVFGSLFFGSVHHIESLLDPIQKTKHIPKVMILEMHQVISVDTSGLDALKTLYHHLRQKNSTLIICAVNPQALSIMKRGEFLDEIGIANCCPDLESAYTRAQSVLTF